MDDVNGGGFDPSKVTAKPKGKRRDGGLVAKAASYPDTCAGCGQSVQPKDSIFWSPQTKDVWHAGCEPAITTRADPDAKQRSRNRSRGKDLQAKTGEDEFDVPIVFRVRAREYNVAVEEVRLMVKDAMERWPVPMKMKLMKLLDKNSKPEDEDD